ncbi:hypothetical protein D3C78_948510 [compost metagenome]
MVFSELVDVVTGSEPFPLRREGVYRDLDHVLVGQQVVVQAQLHRRDDILGVMQDETGELDLRLALKTQKGVDDIVQAVGFAGWAGAGADHLMHIGVVQAHRIDIGLGLRVVGVGADEDLVIFIIDGRGGQACHLAYHADFVPGRDHDCQWFFRRFEQALFIGLFELVVNAQTTDQPAPPIHQVDEQVVQPQQEHEQRQGDRQELEAEQYIGEDVDNGQAHEASRSLAVSSSQRLKRSAMRSLA